MGYREHPKYILVVGIDILRKRALKLGKEFVEEGRLEKKEQIFDLTMAQVTKAEKDRKLKLMPLVEKNTAPYKTVAHIKDWPRIIDSRGKIFRAKREEKEGKEGMVGDAISPGIIKGRAKVLHSPYEKPLLKGEIMVAKMSEPSWTPIFINAAGVVLEVGGPLQHGAIIAREYGIPCVSGVYGATKQIKDGDLLEVDGSDGHVRIINEDNEVVKPTQ
jgi:phosphoenolpyruvate synthase/pyruvate phosphate dikinase